MSDLLHLVRSAVAVGKPDEAVGYTRLLYRASGAHEQWAYWFDKDMRAEFQ